MFTNLTRRKLIKVNDILMNRYLTYPLQPRKSSLSIIINYTDMFIVGLYTLNELCTLIL